MYGNDNLKVLAANVGDMKTWYITSLVELLDFVVGVNNGLNRRASICAHCPFSYDSHFL